MNSIAKIPLLLIAVFIANTALCQDFEVPVNYKLDKSEDYAPYEKRIIACIDWLEKTPINEEKEKREAAKKFLMKWIEGSPNVTIELQGFITTFADKNPELLLAFMGGWTKFVLENPEYLKDKVRGNVAGLRSLLKVYSMGNGMKKDKDIDKLVKLSEDGDLKNWVESQLRKSK